MAKLPIAIAFNERNPLSQAIPQFHVEWMLHEWTPIMRFESQRNERRFYEDQFLFLGRGDMSANKCQRFELQR